MEGTWVQSVVQEDPTCHGATKPVCTAPKPGCAALSPCAHLPSPCAPPRARVHHPWARVHCPEPVCTSLEPVCMSPEPVCAARARVCRPEPVCAALRWHQTLLGSYRDKEETLGHRWTSSLNTQETLLGGGAMGWSVYLRHQSLGTEVLLKHPLCCINKSNSEEPERNEREPLHFNQW